MNGCAVDIEPGRDYLVIVVRGTDEERPGDGLELDALRGNQGTQYYEVSSGTHPGAGSTVLIRCRAFGVPVANFHPGKNLNQQPREEGTCSSR
jgi:hypothetical protein